MKTFSSLTAFSLVAYLVITGHSTGGLLLFVVAIVLLCLPSYEKACNPLTNKRIEKKSAEPKPLSYAAVDYLMEKGSL